MINDEKKESRQSRDSLDWSRLPYLSSGAASVMTLSSNLLASRPQIAQQSTSKVGRHSFKRAGVGGGGGATRQMVWLTLIKEQVSWPNSWYPSPTPTPRALPSISPHVGGGGEAYFTPSWCRPYFNDRKKGWADMNSRERTEVDFNLDEEPRALPHFLFSMGCGRGRPTSTELLRVCCRRMNVMK